MFNQPSSENVYQKLCLHGSEILIRAGEADRVIVKNEDFLKDITQNSVQLESVLLVKQVEQDRLRFKILKPVVVVYGTESMEGNIERVLGHIVWLLREAQNPDSDSEMKRRKSGSEFYPRAYKECEMLRKQNIKVVLRRRKELSFYGLGIEMFPPFEHPPFK
ncbi:hypothetical protein GLOIN_2v1881079 [Rhizophagus clarus]|uniref:Uncharacterized protein n=1 Tax=Rhizophagus clarus TaxID=94130 RepID=A0A8H3LF97_9GLOM|nr:hypothetical protein GLOIN_2v1881079 [Rhizophagus clarus]